MGLSASRFRWACCTACYRIFCGTGFRFARDGGVGRPQRPGLAAELAIPIFEDDPYGCLRYSGQPLPSLKSLAGDSPLVIYASSFSKVLAPGVRVAWTVADPELIRAMVLMRQGADLCTSTVSQALVAEYCHRGLVESHLEHVVDTYAGKCRAMRESLELHVPEDLATWTEPQGGFFFDDAQGFVPFLAEHGFEWSKGRMGRKQAVIALDDSNRILIAPQQIDIFSAAFQRNK